MLGWGGWSQGHFLSPWGPSAQSCPSFRRSWSGLVPALCPHQVSWYGAWPGGMGDFVDLGTGCGSKKAW